MSDPEPITQALRNEIETIRCIVKNVSLDHALIKELLDLREFKAAHPLTPAVERERIKPKSAAIHHMEAILVFNEYAEREMRRLDRKAQAMEAGTFDEIENADREERERNEAIGERAVQLAAA